MIGQDHLIPVDQWSIYLRSCVMRLCEEYAWFVIHHKKEMKKKKKNLPVASNKLILKRRRFFPLVSQP